MEFGRFATRASRTTFRVSLFLASAPLVLGVAIFLLWLPTRWALLEVAGFLNIYAGVLSVCLAGLVFVVHSFQELRSPAGSGEGLVARLVAILAIVFLCFPTCGWILGAVERIQDAEWRARLPAQVQVNNRSEYALEDARFTGLVGLEAATIEPEAAHVWDFEPAEQASGSLSLVGAWRGERKSWSLTSDREFEAKRGYRTVVDLGPDGDVSLSEEDLAATRSD